MRVENHACLEKWWWDYLILDEGRLTVLRRTDTRGEASTESIGQIQTANTLIIIKVRPWLMGIATCVALERRWGLCLLEIDIKQINQLDKAYQTGDHRWPREIALIARVQIQTLARWGLTDQGHHFTNHLPVGITHMDKAIFCSLLFIWCNYRANYF